jgi:hypothetical protein
LDYEKGYGQAPKVSKSFINRFWNKIYSETGYLYSSRTTVYGLFLLFPLLLAYEFLAVKVNESQPIIVRNLADVLLKEFIALFGANAPKYLGAILLAIILLSIFLRKSDTAPFNIRYFFAAIFEGGVYALFLGFVVQQIVGSLFAIINITPGLQNQIMLSLGAGVYEELIFRVLFFRFTAETFIRLFGSSKPVAYFLAALFSSALFSYAHFMGPDNPAFNPFIYRFFMGLFFCLIFWARGLGIAVWTHALYDLFIVINSN